MGHDNIAGGGDIDGKVKEWRGEWRMNYGEYKTREHEKSYLFLCRYLHLCRDKDQPPTEQIQVLTQKLRPAQSCQRGAIPSGNWSTQDGDAKGS